MLGCKSVTITRGVKPCTRYTNTHDVYQMTSIPRGYCLIINNSDFGDDGKRKGAADAVLMTQLFQQFGFTVESYETQNKNAFTKEEVNLHLSSFARESKHGQASCCVVILLSAEGCASDFFPTSTGQVDFRSEVMPLFHEKNAPNLAGKPKIFILQGCRGGQSIPPVNDVIICSATPASYNNGGESFFVKTLVKTFADYGFNLSMQELLTKVQGRMSPGHGQDVKHLVASFQQLHGETSLRYPLYFNPPVETGPLGIGTAFAYWHWCGFPAVIKDDFVRELTKWRKEKCVENVAMKQIIVYSQNCLSKPLGFDSFKESSTSFTIRKDMAGMKARKYGVSVYPISIDGNAFYFTMDYPSILQGISENSNSTKQKLGEVTAFHVAMSRILATESQQNAVVPFVLLPYDDTKEELQDVLSRAVQKMVRPESQVVRCLRGPDAGWKYPQWLEEALPEENVLSGCTSLTDKMPVGHLVAERYAGFFFRIYSTNLQQRIDEFEQQLGQDFDKTPEAEEGVKFTINKLLILLPSSCKVLDTLEDVKGVDMVGNISELQAPATDRKLFLSYRQRYVGHSTVYKLDEDYFIAEFATPLRLLDVMRTRDVIDDNLLGIYYGQLVNRLRTVLQENAFYQNNFELVEYDDRGEASLVETLKCLFSAHK